MRQHVYFYLQYALVLLFVWLYAYDVIFDVNWSGWSYSDFVFSDYLINYQGGIVRRGLIGEILYRFFILKPYNVKHVIIGIDIISLILFLTIAIYVFAKRKWSLLPIFSPLVCAHIKLLSYRRDFIALVLVFVIFFLFFRYVKFRKVGWIVSCVILIGFSILLYEPIFFMSVPVLLVITYELFRYEGETYMLSISKTFVIFLLPVVIMFDVCINKGNDNIAYDIWQSWGLLFELFPEYKTIEMGDGVRFLSRDLCGTVLFHLTETFRLDETPVYKVVLSDALLIMSFPMIYFIVTRVPLIVHNKRKIGDNINHVELSDFIIIQFIAMSPMFGILSCDFGRTIPYCMYTTYFLVYFCEEYQINYIRPRFITSFSNIIQKKIDRIHWLNSFPAYLTILLFTPLGFVGSPKIRSNVAYSITRRIYLLIKSII